MTTSIMAGPRGDAILSTPNSDDEFVDVDDMPPSFPPSKKTRGSVGVDDNIDEKADVIPECLQTPRRPSAIVDKVGGGHCLALVPYAPVPFSDLERRNFLPTPKALRYNPPGCRIRGALPMPMRPPREKAQSQSQSNANGRLGVKEIRIPSMRSDGPTQGKAKIPAKARPVQMNEHIGKKRKNPSQDLEEDGVKFNFPTTVEELKSKNARTRVKYALKEFDNLRRHFMAGEGNKRPDLLAHTALENARPLINGNESLIGPVPGVEVGDFFYYRMELFLIALHRQSQGGIDYITEKRSSFVDTHKNPLSIAVSVIASGGYEDDRDEGDTLIYTGQGGNHQKQKGNRLERQDQQMVRGNKALQNSYDLKIPVRVIRGHDYKKSPVNAGSGTGKVYYYDGLYSVMDVFQTQGVGGSQVIKFKLVRLPGQPPLSTQLVLPQGKSLPSILQQRGEQVILEDLSRGQEPFKVRVVGFDKGRRLPDSFTYIAALQFAPGVAPQAPQPCACQGPCDLRTSCSCMALNGSHVYSDEGCLLRAKKLVYECGKFCKCQKRGHCQSQVAQKGLRYEMEVFQTENKGWGLRSSFFIPQGSYVCEYIGEVIRDVDAEKRVQNDEYMFDLKIPDDMDRRFGHIPGLNRENDASPSDSNDEDTDAYTVDAKRYGNLARFINHSCEPNLFVQCVLYDHHDHRFPHIMLFASEHIKPYTELTYDYGYGLGSVQVNGEIQVKKCCCGAPSCSRRMY